MMMQNKPKHTRRIVKGNILLVDCLFEFTVFDSLRVDTIRVTGAEFDVFYEHDE